MQTCLLFPQAGNLVGGNVITIKGSGFNGTQEIKFGDEIVEQFCVIGETEMLVRVPAAATLGKVNVSIATYDENSLTTNENQYTYVDALPPVIKKISPSSGPFRGGNIMTIYGTHLSGTYQIKFGKIPASNIAVVSDEEVSVKVPSGCIGSCSISLLTFGGITGSSVKSCYTYYDDSWIHYPP